MLQHLSTNAALQSRANSGICVQASCRVERTQRTLASQNHGVRVLALAFWCREAAQVSESGPKDHTEAKAWAAIWCPWAAAKPENGSPLLQRVEASSEAAAGASHPPCQGRGSTIDLLPRDFAHAPLHAGMPCLDKMSSRAWQHVYARQPHQKTEVALWSKSLESIRLLKKDRPLSDRGLPTHQAIDPYR